MVVFLIVIFVISALLLNLIILVQDDQGEGIGGLFGGGGGAIGSRKGNVLSKVTSVLATMFIVTALATAWLNRSVSAEDLEAKARIKRLEQQTTSDWFVETSTGEQTPTPENETVDSQDDTQAEAGSLTSTPDQGE